MENDMSVSDVLREVIDFLECLRDAQLPLMLEGLREKLLERSKNMLRVGTTAPSSSPEPYLDMNAGPKSLLLTKGKADTEEYVGMEESPKQPHQDYYETFEHDSRAVAAATIDRPERKADDRDESQALIGIYKNLTAAQCRIKCHKCGPLYRKEGKKVFMSESRACWIALVGSHLLIYRSERHNRPCAIYPLRGYMARAVPNQLLRGRQKNESSFEIYCPGNETLQFIARTPKDMDQWIVKVCEVGRSDDLGKAKNGVKIDTEKERNGSPSKNRCGRRDDSRHRDAGKSTVVDKPTVKEEPRNNRNVAEKKDEVGSPPPPLPARIPRRLPSLPLDDSVPVYKAAENDDEDDDTYHKIEDLRSGTSYQNMMLRKQRVAVDDEKHEIVAYDDVRVPDEGRESDKGREEKFDAIPAEEMYDDIVTLARSNVVARVKEENRNGDRSVADGNEGVEEFYDDVTNLIPNGRLVKDSVKNQIETSSKSPQKRSFLDRVWSRKESPSKSDKRSRGKVSTPQNAEEMPSYDDVFDLTPNRESSTNDQGEELPEYNCPPPPRPIRPKSPIVDEHVEEIYDDVTTYREQYKYHKRTKEIKNGAMEPSSDGDLPHEEIEHYQSPRSDLCIHDDAAGFQQTEDLYDDIALWADFTARQRDIAERKNSSEDGRPTIGYDKKSRSRFAVNRKSRQNDFPGFAETNRRSVTEDNEENEDSTAESNGLAKRNTFQKLISKMENSLAKVSARSPPALSTNKTIGGTTSNAS